MKILALELSTSRGSLAWWEDKGEPVSRDWRNDRKNSGVFFEELQSITKEFGLPEKIIVGTGPGSYAGTRIAISAAIGLQAASAAELIGLPSICAMECDAPAYCVVGDARRQSFFHARVRANELVEGPVLFGEKELQDKLDDLEAGIPILASEALSQFKGVTMCYPSALVLARLAQSANRSFVSFPFEPMYLREPHITVPRTANPGIGVSSDGDSQAGSPCPNDVSS